MCASKLHRVGPQRRSAQGPGAICEAAAAECWMQMRFRSSCERAEAAAASDMDGAGAFIPHAAGDGRQGWRGRAAASSAGNHAEKQLFRTRIANINAQ